MRPSRLERILRSDAPSIAREVLQHSELQIPINFSWYWNPRPYDYGQAFFQEDAIFVNWLVAKPYAWRPRWQGQLSWAALLAHEATHALFEAANQREPSLRTALLVGWHSSGCWCDEARKMTHRARGFRYEGVLDYRWEMDRMHELLAELGALRLLPNLAFDMEHGEKAREVASQANDRFREWLANVPLPERDGVQMVYDLAGYLLGKPSPPNFEVLLNALVCCL